MTGQAVRAFSSVRAVGAFGALNAVVGSDEAFGVAAEGARGAAFAAFAFVAAGVVFDTGVRAREVAQTGFEFSSFHRTGPGLGVEEPRP